jgi:hypothetical protein
MWKIIDRLYLGDSHAAGDLARLLGGGVSHILNCTAGVPCSYPGEFEYLQVCVTSAEFSEQIGPMCQFIDRGRAAGAVLVHCQEGRERGPAVVVAYLCHLGNSVDKALEVIQGATVERPIAFAPPPARLLRPIAERFGA